MSNQETDKNIMTRMIQQPFKAIYLGSEPMGELLEGENGSDAIQVPLRRIILRTDFSGKEVELSVSNNSLTFTFSQQVNGTNNSSDSTVPLPIELLAYCGALRQLAHDRVETREFETLDKAPTMQEQDALGMAVQPPLFVTIFRCIESENMLFCHAFVLRHDEDAMELVRLVMEVYYNLVKLSSEEDQDEGQNNQVFVQLEGGEKRDNEAAAEKNEEEAADNDAASSYLKQLLNAYNNITLENNKDINTNNKSIISARDFLNENLNPEQYRIVRSAQKNDNEYDENETELNQINGKNGDETINKDSNPIVIKKTNNEEIVYKQNVYIRWLQPPTPPPPAPIISNIIFKIESGLRGLQIQIIKIRIFYLFVNDYCIVFRDNYTKNNILKSF